MVIKVDEKDSIVLALRASEKKLQELMINRSEKEKALATETVKYLQLHKSIQRSRVELEADELLVGKRAELGSEVHANDIERIQHAIEVLDVAIERQRMAVAEVRGQFSMTVCAAHKERYIAIEKRIARAVMELAEANEAEVHFINDLREAGCSTITFRPMRIDQIGFASDPHSRASSHRREVEEFCPEALQ